MLGTSATGVAALDVLALHPGRSDPFLLHLCRFSNLRRTPHPPKSPLPASARERLSQRQVQLSERDCLVLVSLGHLAKLVDVERTDRRERVVRLLLRSVVSACLRSMSRRLGHPHGRRDYDGGRVKDPADERRRGSHLDGRRSAMRGSRRLRTRSRPTDRRGRAVRSSHRVPVLV